MAVDLDSSVNTATCALCSKLIQFTASSCTVLHLTLYVQAAKPEDGQKDVASYLSPHDLSTTADVCIVGCGPAGLALSAQVAEKGLKVLHFTGFAELAQRSLVFLMGYSCGRVDTS